MAKYHWYDIAVFTLYSFSSGMPPQQEKYVTVTDKSEIKIRPFYLVTMI